MIDPVHQNFQRIKNEIASFGQVYVIAVTKFQPIEKVRCAVEAGVVALGVNHTHQGEELKNEFGKTSTELHFIGHIQSRKAKLLTGYSLIQSLDRLVIVDEWKKHLIGTNPIDVLVEVNIGEEPQKSGVMPAELGRFMSAVKEYPFVRVRGLMAMPPFLEPPPTRVPFFKKMRQLFEMYQDNVFSILSMGTSTDYMIALSEGSNMIRLGTTLFGERGR